MMSLAAAYLTAASIADSQTLHCRAGVRRVPLGRRRKLVNEPKALGSQIKTAEIVPAHSGFCLSSFKVKAPHR
jgi:hypothetical protein